MTAASKKALKPYFNRLLTKKEIAEMERKSEIAEADLVEFIPERGEPSPSEGEKE